jgi:hypothetical protein
VSTLLENREAHLLQTLPFAGSEHSARLARQTGLRSAYTPYAAGVVAASCGGSGAGSSKLPPPPRVGGVASASPPDTPPTAASAASAPAADEAEDSPCSHSRCVVASISDDTKARIEADVVTEHAEVVFVHTDDESFKTVAKLSWLRRLDLSGEPITDLSPIANLVELTELDLSGTKVTTLAVPAPLAKLEKLNEFPRTRPSARSPASSGWRPNTSSGRASLSSPR